VTLCRFCNARDVSRSLRHPDELRSRPLIPDITHVVPGRGELLPRLESGDYEATLIPVHRFDAYRIGHPDTKLRLSGYYLPIGFNMGFVGLASDARLIDRVTLHQGLWLHVRGLSNLLDGCGMDVASGRPFAIHAHAGLDLADLVAQGPRSRLLDPYILFSLRTA
jgi:hypothetical protein